MPEMASDAQMLRSAHYADKITEEYIFIAETDHLLMQATSANSPGELRPY